MGMEDKSVFALVASAGQGKRMNRGMNKNFIDLAGRHVLMHSLTALSRCPEIEKIIVIVAQGEERAVEEMLSQVQELKKWLVVTGGAERQESIRNGLAHVPETVRWVLVHDGARPLVDEELIRRVISEAYHWEAAGAAVPVKDTIKRANQDGFVEETPCRSSLWAMQTPQVFASTLLRKAYHKAENEGFLGTDDASLVERMGKKVKLVLGSYRNIKVTTPDDMIFAEAVFGEGKAKRGDGMQRVGSGYDVHRLVTGRPLVLGGVTIPHSHGLDGHSDADVLLHAMKDALLGAAALGDIGRHFPDTDARYKGVSSLLLLKEVNGILHRRGYRVYNVDGTIVAQKPKLASYMEEMRRNIADALEVDLDFVNVKATTTEGLGFTGRQEGIAAYAVASIVLRETTG